MALAILWGAGRGDPAQPQPVLAGEHERRNVFRGIEARHEAVHRALTMKGATKKSFPVGKMKKVAGRAHTHHGVSREMGGAVMSGRAVVLRTVARAVAPEHPPTDRELLRRFAHESDQGAFEVLVKRHTGMVLGVCRRALPSVQDAEDACQATFLVLARRAKDGGWHESVANWLYTTARKVAANARTAAARRARREQNAAVSETVEPVDRMTGRELLAALDRALDALPARYREPLVLCYLEGLTPAAAAARLGIPCATLHTRIGRARKRLHAVLTRAGCSLGSGLLTLAITTPAGALRPQLLESILQAVAGAPRPAAVALAKSAAALVPGRAVRLVALAAVVIAVAAGSDGAGRPTGSAQPARPSADSASPALPPKPAADDSRTALRGRVVGADGKPAAGAEVFLFREENDRPERLGATDADGAFTCRVPRDLMGASLAARAEGAGVGFIGLGRVNPAQAVELRLVADEAIRGRVIDTQGKPVAGARVTPWQISWSPGRSADWFLKPWKTRDPRHPFPAAPERLRQSPGGSFLATTTDATGRFVVTGTGAERVVVLRVSGTGVADTDLYVVTRPDLDPTPYNEAAAKNVRPDERDRVFVPPLHGPAVSAVVEPEKVIRGTVTVAGADGKPDQPQAGATVVLTGPVGLIRHRATTGADGCYEIRGARKATEYVLDVLGDPGAGLLPGWRRVADSPGYAPLTANVFVRPGVVITGRVVDKGTGRPVPGWVATAPMADNTFATHRKGYEAATWNATWRYTEPDGTFRVVAVPGPVLLMGGVDGRKERDLPAGVRFKPAVADSTFARYFSARDGFTEFYNPDGSQSPLQGNYCKVFELKEGAGAVKHDVILEPAQARSVAVRGPDGKPAKGVLVSGVGPVGSRAVLVESDTCAAYHLERRVDRLMVFYEPTKKLYGTLTLNGDGKDPVTVTLAPAGSVTGRLVGADGKPVVGTVVRVRLADAGANEVVHAATGEMPTVTGADGAFRLDALPARAEVHPDRSARETGGRTRPVPARPGRGVEARRATRTRLHYSEEEPRRRVEWQRKGARPCSDDRPARSVRDRQDSAPRERHRIARPATGEAPRKLGIRGPEVSVLSTTSTVPPRR